MFCKIFLSCICLLILVKVQSQQDTSAVKLSLQQCIQIALKNNADIQHREVTSDIQKNDLLGARGNMLPTLNGDISHGINKGRSIDPFTNTYADQKTKVASFNLSTGVTLFNAFAIRNNIKQNRLAYDATKMEVQQQKDAVALNVILEYLQVLTNEDLVNVSMQQRDVSAKQVERNNILNEEGAVSPSQLYDIKGQYQREQLNVINAMNDLQTAKVSLAQLLNIPYNKNMQVERISLNETLADNISGTDSIYQSALQNLAIIKATELRQRSAEFNVKTYRSQQYPSLVFNGGLNTNYSSNASAQQFINSTDVTTSSYVLVDGNKTPVIAKQDNYSFNTIKYGNQFKNNYNNYVSIAIQIPLLNNFRNKVQIKTAEAYKKDAEITLNATKTQLQQNIEQAGINLNTAQQRYDVLTEQVAAYKESFREAEVRFDAGAINSVDYLVTKTNLDNSNINLIIARYDYILSSMILDYYSGKLSFQ